MKSGTYNFEIPWAPSELLQTGKAKPVFLADFLVLGSSNSKGLVEFQNKEKSKINTFKELKRDFWIQVMEFIGASRHYLISVILHLAST